MGSLFSNSSFSALEALILSREPFQQSSLTVRVTGIGFQGIIPWQVVIEIYIYNIQYVPYRMSYKSTNRRNTCVRKLNMIILLVLSDMHTKLGIREYVKVKLPSDRLKG